MFYRYFIKVSRLAAIVLLSALQACETNRDITQMTGTSSFYSTLAEDYPIQKTWDRGDLINVLWDGGSVKAEAVGGKKSSLFSTKESIIPDGANIYYAIYPSSFPAEVKDGRLVIDYGTTQKGTLKRARIYSAHTENLKDGFKFKCNGAILSFLDKKHSLAEFRCDGSNDARCRIVSTDTTYLALPPEADLSLGFQIILDGKDTVSFPPMSINHTDIAFLGNLCGEDEISVLFHNILLGKYSTGESYKLWSYRKPGIAEMINTNKPDIIGLCECDSEQLSDILSLCPEYYHIGNVSSQGNSSSFIEASNPILFKSSAFTLLNHGEFWLSDTPASVSLTWQDDAKTLNQYRYCTWAKFSDPHHGNRTFFIFNTHFANGTAGAKSRENSIELCLKKINEISSGLPVIFMGDLNTNTNSPIFSEFAKRMTEARKSCPSTDTGHTYNAFGLSGGSTLDHIFFYGMTGNVFKVDRRQYCGIEYISDHYPIISDLNFTDQPSSVAE